MLVVFSASFSLSTKISSCVLCFFLVVISFLPAIAVEKLVSFNFEKRKTSFPANIRLDEDVLKTSFVFVLKTSSRSLDQDEYVDLSLMSSEDVFKTSSKRLGEDQYIRLGYTSSRRLQDVFKTS